MRQVIAKALCRLRAEGILVVALLICPVLVASANEGTNAAVRAPDAAPASETLRAYLLIQEQMRATQMALEKNRQETEAMTARNANAIADQLKALAESMNLQRARELEAMQSTNHLLLVVVAAFACFGFLSMLFSAWMQVRAVNRLTEFTAMLPARLGLTPMPLQSNLLTNAAAKANTEFFGTLDRIEKRVVELEQAAEPPAHAGANNSAPKASLTEATDAQAREAIPVLLAKGQSFLSVDKPTEALACYDEILRLDVNHAEALVKKGTALELLRRDEDALVCYDRAIQVDSSLTIAYLQKGGLFNRLERFQEALECYERALQTQDRARQKN